AVVSAALEFRDRAGGDLRQWSPWQVRTLMRQWFPRTVTLRETELPGVVPALHGMVDFLAEGSGRDPADLHAEIDRGEAEFLAAMTDERRFGMPKFWTARMLEHGVDLSDRDRVRRFATEAAAGSVPFDRETATAILRRPPADMGFDEQPAMPPVVLPPPERLPALAESARLTGRLRAFVDWVGAGRSLTPNQRLRIHDARELASLLGLDQRHRDGASSGADLPEVALLVEWARAARAVRVAGDRLVPSDRPEAMLNRSLELWQRLFSALDRLGETVCASAQDGPSVLGEVFDEVVRELWMCLYTAGGTPVPVELLVDLVRENLGEQFSVSRHPLLGKMTDLMWRWELASVLGAMELLGAIESTVVSDPAEREQLVELSGTDDPDLTLVALTPLALWAVRESFLDAGFAAPDVHELLGLDAEELYDQLYEVSRPVLDTALGLWAAAREPAEAAGELARFAQEVPSPETRRFLKAGLAHTGDAGISEAHRLRSLGGVLGAVATAFLLQHSALGESEATEEELALANVDEERADRAHESRS
ncbi:hypothetical protein, partial [Amycolatopsis rhizosphaerae]|uniref:hypothetical protein n=1 Tax=Amycolatopsis rhizosphaerae TaxID=2053003 RepID=UPI00164383C9